MYNVVEGLLAGGGGGRRAESGERKAEGGREGGKMVRCTPSRATPRHATRPNF